MNKEQFAFNVYRQYNYFIKQNQRIYPTVDTNVKVYCETSSIKILEITWLRLLINKMY